ncbi:MAG: hypothetical protein COA58_13870 [Bacteroidetes bacterium]|nr:MAG: hypothetical protein COA58_13870 [Bacteroidota bacterium]
MGEIYNQFLVELQLLQEKHRNNPKEELNQLLILALEREELVATSYQDSVLNKSISKLQVSDEYKRIFRHGFIWIWKDEEMHTDFVRSGLLKTKNTFSSLQIFMSQIQGFIGGWSGSVLQLSTFRNAPIAFVFAHFFKWMGALGGKVPKEIRAKLNAGTLKDFCAFNVDAEKTAWACWKRIVELAIDDDRFDEKQIKDFVKIIADEHNHGKIFSIFYDALNDDSTIKSEMSLNRLVQEVGEVSDYFLPREYRRNLEDNPLGKERVVYCHKDDTGAGREASLTKVLTTSELDKSLHEKASTLHKKIEELEVVIKIPITMGYDQKDQSPIVEEEVIRVFVHFLKEVGVTKIKLLDVQSIYSKFFENRSVEEIAQYFGYPVDVEIIDGSLDLVSYEYSRGIGIYEISKTWKNADFRISLGKLRSHPTELAMVSIANLEWLVGHLEDFVFVDKIVDRAATTMVLLDEYPPEFAVVDAYQNIPDSLVGVMGSKHPVNPHRFYASRDALSLDKTIMSHLGLKKMSDDSLLGTIEYWFGGTDMAIEVIGTNDSIKEWRGPTRNFFWSFLNLLSYPVYKFISGRGLLFLPPMDTKVFPYKTKPNFLLKLVIGLNNRIIGLK